MIDLTYLTPICSAANPDNSERTIGERNFRTTTIIFFFFASPPVPHPLLFSMLHVYCTLTSQPSRAVRHLLEELNVPYRLQLYCPRTSSENEKTLYKQRINPLGQVPSLIDTSNGFVLYESNAILQYLSNKFSSNTSPSPSSSSLSSSLSPSLSPCSCSWYP
jgi:hypothetical protein